MVSHPPVDWDDVASTATISGSLGEELREVTVQLPSSEEPGLERFWPIPLYGLTYFVHRRYRLWKPRTLPTLTNLKPGAIYASIALGHAADIEATRLRDKLVREADTDRLSVDRFSVAIGTAFGRYVEQVNKDPGLSWPGRSTTPDLTHPGTFPPSQLLTELYVYYLWRVRNLWSDTTSRQLASLLLQRAIVEHGLSEHDAHILVRSVAGCMLAGQGSHWQVLSRTFQGHIPAIFAFVTTLGLYDRWRALPMEVRVASRAWQGVLFHLWVYRSLWGRYRHWRLLYSLEDPAKAAAAMYSAAVMIQERLEARAEKR